ncbi:hypothetical protein H0H93_001917 [Arthromyces matolae]|nr:hypothetical protein H0H93_001917 [Arthromyces matolae]
MAKSDKKADKKVKAVAPKVDKKAAPEKPAPKVKETVAKVDKKSKGKAPAKPVKKAESSDEESSDSEEEEVKPTNGKGKEVSSDESSESSSEDEKPKAAQVKAAPAKAAADSDSDSDDSSDEEPAPKKKAAPAPTPKKAAPAPAPKKAAPPAKKAESSSEDESSDDDEPPKKAAAKDESSSEESDSDDEPAPKKTAPAAAAAKKAESSDESDDSSSEEEAPKKKAADAEESDSDDSSSDEDSDVEMKDETAAAPAKSAKRKAEDDEPVAPKKAKLANGEAVATSGDAEESKSIFVGRLSWNVDNDMLAAAFAECGEVVSATVQMDRTTGKSRGFGYVHFASGDAVEKALAMNGQEIDGRPVNIDRSSGPVDRTQARDNRAKAFGDKPSEPSATLFVGNLPFSSNEDSVWSFFNDHGVKSVRLPTDRETGQPKGFGYVEFEDIEGAKAAYEAHKNAEMDGPASKASPNSGETVHLLPTCCVECEATGGVESVMGEGKQNAN